MTSKQFLQNQISYLINKVQNLQSLPTGTYYGDYLFWNPNASPPAFEVGSNAVHFGTNAGSINSAQNTVAIGYSAGKNNLNERSVAIGYFSGANLNSENAGTDNVFMGSYAGQEANSSCNNAVYIGYNAGKSGSGEGGVAIGQNSGMNSSAFSVAVGAESGRISQSTESVAVGYAAGRQTQGEYAIAIGAYAGYNNQPAGSIVMNASGAQLNPATVGFFVNPIASRNTQFNRVLSYDPSSNEVHYNLNTPLVFISGPNTISSLSCNTFVHDIMITSPQSNQKWKVEFSVASTYNLTANSQLGLAAALYDTALIYPSLFKQTNSCYSISNYAGTHTINCNATWSWTDYFDLSSNSNTSFNLCWYVNTTVVSTFPSLIWTVCFTSYT